MKRKFNRFIILSLSTSAALSSAVAFGGVFEAISPSNAHVLAVGGASASNITGANAVLLNPAGLASSDTGFHGIVTAMPALYNANAPLTGPNTSTAARQSIVPLFDLAGAYQISPDLTAGLGLTVAGGQGLDYGHVSITGYPNQIQFKQLIGSIEADLGLSYKITPEFSLGAAWRVTAFVPGELHSASLSGTTLSSLDVTGLTGATNFSGFRVGAQYRNKEQNWGVGATFRNAITWNLTGTATSTQQTPGAVTFSGLSLGAFSSSQVFPWRGSVGGDFDLFSQFHVYLEYAFLNYSVNATQSFTTAVGGTSTITLAQQDQHDIHVGFQYGEEKKWPIRVGYVLETSGITPSNPGIFGYPGMTHGFSAGTETTVGDMPLSGALTYQMSSLTGTGTTTAGNYNLSILALALTLSM